MQVEKIHSQENWYKATTILPNGAVATGFGTTYSNAIADCMRDMEIIEKLTVNLKKHD